MPSANTLQGSLAERIAELRYALMRDLPFFGHLLLSIPLHIEPNGSLVVTNEGTIGVLYLDGAFARGLTRGELGTVLLHGVLHLAFGCFHRQRERDQGLWNQAHDYAINLVIEELRSAYPRMGLEWPADKLLSPKWKGLSAEAIYDRLVMERQMTAPRHDTSKDKRQAQGGSEIPTASKGASTIVGHSQTGQTGGQEGMPSDLQKEVSNVLGTGVSEIAVASNTLSIGEHTPSQKGCILLPRSGGRGFQDATDCVLVRREGVSQDAETLEASLQERALRNLLAEAMAMQNSRSTGHLPASLGEWVELALRPPIPWVDQFLQRMQGRLRGERLSYSRLSKRSQALCEEEIVLPGRARNQPLVAIILDTSGSMAAGDLAEFLSTVRHITETLNAGIRLLQVDAEIQSDEVVDDFDLALGQQFELLGRGGTVFDDLPSRLEDPTYESVDLAILFTDGMPVSWPPAEAWGTDLLVVTTSVLPPEGYTAVAFSPTHGRPYTPSHD